MDGGADSRNGDQKPLKNILQKPIKYVKPFNGLGSAPTPI